MLYRHAWFDLAADEIRGAIHRVDRDGRERPFTSGTNDRLARFSPDGTAVAFVAEREGTARLYVLRLDGGEAAALGEGYDKITALAWAPDSKRIAFLATAPHDAASAAVFYDAKSGARHIRRLPYKSDSEGLYDGRRKHLFVIDADASGSAHRLTSGDFDAGPPSWSTDGARIAFTARVLDVPEWTIAVADVCVVDVASGEVRRLTKGTGPMALPVFSRDGREIAFYGHHHGDDAGGRFDEELLVIAADGGETRSLSASLGRAAVDHVTGDLRTGAPAPPAWSADDREVLALVCDEGTSTVRAFARDGSGTRTIAGGERQIFAFGIATDGSIALAYATPTVPNEIVLIERYGAERKLTDVNAWLSEKYVAEPVRYRPRADDGTVLDAWLVSPRESAREPGPLVLEVHGGPHSAYGFTFFLEFQILAGAGIAVAYGNPRGSQSYGHAYADAITGDWGGIDVADVLRILDGALEQGRFDSKRIGVAGGSYGGFMTTWLAGHSDRFAAGVSMRAVNDFVSEVGASDLGWFLERELRTDSSGDAGRALFERSPMRAANAIALPLLVEHTERDYRCPIDQGEQLFTTLRRLGHVETEFVRYTDTGHELSRSGKPRTRILRLRAIAHWFRRHLMPHENGARDAGSLFAPLPGETPLDDDGPL